MRTDFTRSYWAENWQRTLRDWEDRQSVVSVGLLVLALLGYGAIAQKEEVALAGVYVAGLYLFLKVFLLVPLDMWNDARQEIGTYKERLRPQLAFSYDAGKPPYLYLFKHAREDGRFRRVSRILRVGVRNESAETIKGVRVVLESAVYVLDGVHVEPDIRQPALIEHALNVMGIDSRDGRVDVAPGDIPTAYFDVAVQEIIEDRPPDEWFSICYASTHRSPMHAPAKWIIGLRVEGGNTYRRAKFEIDGEGGELVMRTLAF